MINVQYVWIRQEMVNFKFTLINMISDDGQT